LVGSAASDLVADQSGGHFHGFDEVKINVIARMAPMNGI